MVEQQTPVRFFLGANTPNGFTGFHHELYDARDGWRVFLIKSGPGTGKSTLMRRVLEQLTAHGIETELILCSSDPDSIDGVIATKQRVAILDATAPHVLEPKYWGAVERIVDLSSAMDADMLFQNQQAIVAATDACSATHARSRRFLSAAASVLGDNARIATDCTDTEKTTRNADSIADKELGESADSSAITRRFLSAVTPQGMITQYTTLQALCPRIYSIEDEYGAVSRIWMDRIAKRVAASGQRAFVCLCPLAPNDKIEHILLPDLGVGFTVSNTFHKADFPVYRRIHAARFTDTDALKRKKQRLQFNRRIARELLDEAVNLSTLAKAQHDKMEQLNIAAMDWEKANTISAHVLKSFQQIIENN